MKRILLLMMVAASLMSCRKEPDMSQTDGRYYVYTSYDKTADFSKYDTFIVADSVLVMDSGRPVYLKSSESGFPEEHHLLVQPVLAGRKIYRCFLDL